MHDPVADLAKRGRELDPADRSRLVDMLLVSLHDAPITEVKAAWDAEVERRLAAHDQGEVEPVEGAVVLARARHLADQ